ncbi:MAG: hypothetical protein C4547_13050 [Phycisphaerales bacterium]|nr:MAG: hypothetical protein C4547_13050 [Phycisphaerales bacterium]
MTRQSQLSVILGLMGVALSAPAARADDLADLLAVMPGDQAVAIAVVNPDQLEKSIQAVAKRMDGGGDAGFLADLKSHLRLGKDVDFTRPLGILIGGQPPTWGEPVFVVEFPDAQAQIKSIEGASEEGGVWTLPDAGLVVRIVGKHVMVSESGDSVRAVADSKVRLAENVKHHAAAIRGRDVIVRLDVEKVRPMLKMGLEQGRQMMPVILAMSMGQGGDPTGSVNVVNAILAAAGAFVDQVESVVLAGTLTRDDLNLCVSAGFAEGGIRNYLTAQKPPRQPFFTLLNNQPFMYAFAADLPGDQAPFFDYLAGAMKSAAPSAAPAGGQETPEAPEGGSQATPDAGPQAGEEATLKALEFYRMFEGNEALAAFTEEGMLSCGYYTSRDPHKFVETMKEALIARSQLMRLASGGMTFAIGQPRSYGDVQTVELEMKFDPADPQGAMAAQILGGATQMSIAARDGRVGMAAGPEAYREAFFTGKVETPLASSPFVKAALEALPGRPNAVVVIDPAGVMPMLGAIAPMMGGPANLPKLPPGPAISAGVTLSDHPARLDVNVPWAAIERIVKALEADAPM